MKFDIKQALLKAATVAVVVVFQTQARAEQNFIQDIAPIVVKNCIACHGERTALGGYRMHTLEAMMRPGASGRSPIAARDSEHSLVYTRMVSIDLDKRMPQGGEKLPPVMINAFRMWINEGAKAPGVDPKIPLVKLMGPRSHPAAPATYTAPPPLAAVAFSADGNTIATGGYREVLFWNRTTGTLVKRAGGVPERIRAIQWLNADQLVIAGGIPGEYGEAAVINFKAGRRTGVLATFPDVASSVAVSPDGLHVAAGCADGSVICAELASAKQLWSSKVHADQVTGLAFSANGQFVASTGRDKVVKVYDAADGTLYTTYNGHNRNNGRYRGQAPVFAIAPDGTAGFVTVGGGQWVQTWNPEKAKAETGDAGDMETRFFTQGHTRYAEHGLTGDVFAMAVVGATAYVAGEGGVIQRVSLASDEKSKEVGKQADWVYGLAASPDGKWLAAVGFKGVLQVIPTDGSSPGTAWVAAPVAPPTAKQRTKQK
ncbi:MAG: c-type cytochrome domain-containing protein [Armatimonadaceae bacterium]